MSFVREDGRTPFELRACDCEQSTLSRADGSARLKHGDTDVITAVYGPMRPKNSRLEDVQEATFTVVVKPAMGLPGAYEKEMEMIVRQTFEEVVLAAKHPRTNIRIVVQVVKDDGSLFSTVLNCVTLGLIDAGIEMKSPVLSAVCAVSADGELLLDPTKRECESDGVALVEVAGFTEKIISTRTNGLLSNEKFDAALIAIQRAMPVVAAFIRLAVEGKYR
eukprot:g69.t1